MKYPKVIYHGLPKPNSWCRWIVHRVKRLNNSSNIRLVGDTGCLDEKTIIYGHNKTLGELFLDGNKFIKTISLAKAKGNVGSYFFVESTSEIIPSGKKEVFEIELDNGNKVIASSDHIFFKQEKNSFKEERLNNLKDGDYIRYFTPNYIEGFIKKRRENTLISLSNRKKTIRTCAKCRNLFHHRYGKRYHGNICRNCLSSSIINVEKKKKEVISN